ncbi:MAG: SPOR domain-containing protein [Sphingorhabdus sp.]
MSDENNDGLDLDDPDRLPWLETADGYEYDDGSSPLKVAALVLGGLALLALIVGGIYWMQRNQTGTGEGTGELIAAQEGDYKVRPEEAGGKKFEGEGDAAFAAADGKRTSSTVGSAKPAGPKSGTGGKIAAGSTFVQLGAFGDVANAKETWSNLSKRFGFLNGVKHRVAEGKADGGRTVFRLQAATSNAAQAQQLCAKLKAAGENCLIVK